MINVLGALVFFFFFVEKILEYTGPDGKVMDLFGATIFGIMSLVKLTDVMGHLRKKRTSVERAD